MTRLLGWIAVFISWFSWAAAQDLPPREVSLDEVLEIFGQMDMPAALNQDRVSLGRQLFHDPRLSSNDQVSCASCHIISDGGDDNRQFSIGVSGKPTTRNSPSVFNLENHVAYFWDGRSVSLEDQIDGPIHNPDEMNTDWISIIRKLNKDKAFSASFRKEYETINTDAIKDAIAVFEKSLVTNDSPFDRFMTGDKLALGEKAKRGLSRFIDYGCASCHQGPALGGNVFQRFGIYKDDVDDRPLLKVPSLRNVAVTAPYFHDGREAELSNAVRTMARVQLGREINDVELEEIFDFLHSLTSARFSVVEE